MWYYRRREPEPLPFEPDSGAGLLALREPVTIRSADGGRWETSISTGVFRGLDLAGRHGLEITSIREGGRWMVDRSVRALNVYLRAAGGLDWWARRNLTMGTAGHLSRYGWDDFKAHLALEFRAP